MKKIRWLYLAFIFAIVLSSYTYVKAASKEELKQSWYETGEYSVSVDSEEWNKHRMMELIDILNPPEDLLKEYSSEKLASLMMEWPFLWVLPSYEYENKDWFFQFAKHSNIYNELMERPDGKKCLLEAYRNSGIDIQLLNSDPYIIWRLNTKVNAEIFGCQFINFFIHDFDEEELNLSKRIMDEKQLIYDELEHRITKQYLSFIKNQNEQGNETKKKQGESIYPARDSVGFTATGGTTAIYIVQSYYNFNNGYYSKYGVSSSCYEWFLDSNYYLNNNYDTNQITLLNGSIVIPYSIRIADASPKYNCHSYAWIDDSADNTYWLSSPLLYTCSTQVTYVGANVMPLVGDIIVYLDDSTNAYNHSGIVVSTPAGATGIFVRSKFGGKALYDAPLYDVGAYHNSHNHYLVYR